MSNSRIPVFTKEQWQETYEAAKAKVAAFSSMRGEEYVTRMYDLGAIDQKMFEALLKNQEKRFERYMAWRESEAMPGEIKPWEEIVPGHCIAVMLADDAAGAMVMEINTHTLPRKTGFRYFEISADGFESAASLLRNHLNQPHNGSLQTN